MLAGRVEFNNENGTRLVADYTPASAGRPVLVLMHGLGAGRGEWRGWTSSLSAHGYGVFAFDARGHGESGGPNFKTFQSAAAWRALAGDFLAAKAFLYRGGVTKGSVIFGGASVGANLALIAAAKAKDVPLVVMLSPGYAYAGVGLEGVVEKFDRPIVYAAAVDDAYAYKTLGWLEARIKNKKSVLIHAASGHGAGMLSGAANQKFIRELLPALDALTTSSAWSSERPASP